MARSTAKDFTDLIHFRGRPKEQYAPIPRRINNAPSSPYGAPRKHQSLSPGRRQRAVAIAHYFPPQTFDKAADYLHKEGKGKDGGKPERFTREGEELPLETVPGEPRHWRIKLSPEHGDRLNMERYTRDFMTRVEAQRPAISDDGRPPAPLLWLAAVHYNTEHPHAHILIRGLDAEGKDVIFPPSFVSHQFREIAQDIATRELGPRTVEEIQFQKEREITAERYTYLDRSIDREMNPLTNEIRTDNRDLDQRLDYLVQTAEAEELSPHHYRLKAGWDKDLRTKGERNDILKALFADMREKAPDAEHTYIYRKGWLIEGTVIYKGIDEDSYREEPYAVIKQGAASYYYRSEKAKELVVGDRVRLDHGVQFILESAKTKTNDHDLSLADDQDRRIPYPGQQRNDRNIDRSEDFPR